jgi:hypothetical protein
MGGLSDSLSDSLPILKLLAAEWTEQNGLVVPSNTLFGLRESDR